MGAFVKDIREEANACYYLLLLECRSRNEKRGNWLLHLRKLNLKFQELLHPGKDQVSTKATTTIPC